MFALLYGGFSSCTLHFIHPHRTTSLTERSFVRGCERCPETDLSAENVCVLNGPVIVAYGTPFSFMSHLNSTFGMSVTSSKTGVVARNKSSVEPIVSQEWRSFAIQINRYVFLADMSSPPSMMAFVKLRFFPRAGHLFEPVMSDRVDCALIPHNIPLNIWISEVPTCDVRLEMSPPISTHRSPHTIVKYLQVTTRYESVLRLSHQPQLHLL